MAHVMKIKATGVAPMVAHYERTPEIERGFRRENIDPERTSENYNLRPSNVSEQIHQAMQEHERVAKRAVRSDANVLVDWVVTLPKDCQGKDARGFFEAVTEFIEDRYGKKNVVGAYVHMDETTPHIHVPVVPAIEGKLQASKMINRKDLQSFHGELGKFVDKSLGYHVSIELDESQKGEKQLSHLSQTEYIAAKKEIEATQERLERLRCELAKKELEPAQETLSESLRTLYKARSDEKREEVLGRDIDGLRERIRCLRERIASVRGRIVELKQSIAELLKRQNRPSLSELAHNAEIASRLLSRESKGRFRGSREER